MLFLSIGLEYFVNTCTELFKVSLRFTVCAKLSRRFSLFCLPIGCHSKHHNRCNIHLNEPTTGQAASKSDKTSEQLYNSCFCILRMKVFANIILEHYSRTAFTKTVCILRTGLRRNWASNTRTARLTDETGENIMARQPRYA